MQRLCCRLQSTAGGFNFQRRFRLIHTNFDYPAFSRIRQHKYLPLLKFFGHFGMLIEHLSNPPQAEFSHLKIIFINIKGLEGLANLAILRKIRIFTIIT
jgi:hypothetical protein